jgi:selenocysteine-specific elongation factor
MIVATAGHVDHGKTALIRALTGVDTDRLPEEKSRGLSIDLGFAYSDLDDGRVLGFVDVPGHEKFIRNMLTGVSAIHFALFVVAADDGPMPQTVEHLAILDLLAVSRGALVVSKIDVVEPDRVRQVSREIRALVAGTGLAEAPLFPVCAVTGQGIADLKRHIENAAAAFEPPPPSGNFRLAVDRRFTLPGAGLVVTGPVLSGAVSQNDRLFHLPSGVEVRVRALRAQNRVADMGRMGERCALNLTGADLGKANIGRGDWLVAASAATTTRRLDVRIRVPPEGRPLEHWTAAHLHLAAADVMCRIALLETDTLAPGQSGLGRLYADHALAAVRGDRFILRNQSARETIAGGRVVDPLPPARGRASPARLAYLEAMSEREPHRALALALTTAPEGMALDAFVRAWNLTPEEAADVIGRVAMVDVGGGDDYWGVEQGHWEHLSTALGDALDQWHRRYPERLGASAQQLGRLLPRRLPEVLCVAKLTALVAQDEIARRGAVYHRPAHKARLSGNDERLWERVRPLLYADGLRPPPLGDLSEILEMPLKETDSFLARVASMGLVVRIARNRYFPPPTLRALALIGEKLAGEGRFTATAFRDRSGIGRNLVIQVLEFFDRARFTLRDGDHRRILLPSSSIFGSDDKA